MTNLTELLICDLMNEYEISGFAHLFDVAVALNLAYSFLNRVHNFWKQICRKSIAEATADWLSKEAVSQKKPKNSAERNERIINDYHKDVIVTWLKTHEDRSRCWVEIARMYGFGATAVLTVLLGFIGFHHDIKVCQTLIWIAIIFLVAPVPTGLLAQLIYWRRVSSKTRIKLQDRNKELEVSKKKAQEKGRTVIEKQKKKS